MKDGFNTRMSRRGAISVAATIVLTLPQIARSALPIMVGSKIDIEGMILGNIISGALERGGIFVQRKLRTGPTDVVRQSLLSGEIDIYCEYTGNGSIFFEGIPDSIWSDDEAAYNEVKSLDAKQNDLIWLDPAPANNVWGIAVDKEIAYKHNLASLYDFAQFVKQGLARIACTKEFTEDPYALPRIEAKYGFRIAGNQVVLIDGDSRSTMRAVSEKIRDVNCAMVYGTDVGEDKFKLTRMTDPLRSQIAFQPTPVVRADAIRRLPSIREIIDPTFKSIDQIQLEKLNKLVVVDDLNPEAVADMFLNKTGEFSDRP